MYTLMMYPVTFSVDFPNHCHLEQASMVGLREFAGDTPARADESEL